MYTHPSKATLAMKLGGQKRFQFVREKHWIALSNSLNMRPSFLFSTLSTLSKKIKIASTTLVSKLNQDEKTACSVYEEIDKIIQKQSRQLPDKS